MGLNLANKYTGTRLYQFNRFGILMKSFPTYHAASVEHNFDAASLSKCVGAKDSRRKSVAGYYFSDSPQTPPFFYSRSYPVMVDISTSKKIKAFESINEAGRHVGVKYTTCIKGALENNNYTAYGYKWEMVGYSECLKLGLFA